MIIKRRPNRSAKRYLSSGLYYSGLIPMIKNIFGRCGIVLYFHEIYDNKDNTSWCQERSLLIQKELFQYLLEYFSRHYRFVSLDEAVSSHSGDAMAITFDDGFRGTYANAYPILKSMGATATVFLITGLIGSNKLPWWDKLISQLKHFMPLSEMEKSVMATKLSPNWRVLLLKSHNLDTILAAFKVSSDKDREELVSFLNQVTPSSHSHNNRIFLSLDEIREMQSNGICFGSHSKRHPILTWLDQKSLLEELTESKSEVLQITGAKECWFAYPDGMFSSREEKAVKEVGYFGAVKTFRNPKIYGRFAFPRISLKEDRIISSEQKLSTPQVEFDILKHRMGNFHAFR